MKVQGAVLAKHVGGVGTEGEEDPQGDVRWGAKGEGNHPLPSFFFF